MNFKQWCKPAHAVMFTREDMEHAWDAGQAQKQKEIDKLEVKFKRLQGKIEAVAKRAELRRGD